MTKNWLIAGAVAVLAGALLVSLGVITAADLRHAVIELWENLPKGETE